jgi:hypothetical protein
MITPWHFDIPDTGGAGNYLNKDTDLTDVSAHNPKRGKGPRLG